MTNEMIYELLHALLSDTLPEMFKFGIVALGLLAHERQGNKRRGKK